MRLAICDKQWLFASVIAAALAECGHEVLATTDDPVRLLESAAAQHPDVCVLDAIDRPLATAELGARLHALRPAPYVVLLADSQDDRAWEAYERGFADGLVNKACSLQTLLTAVESVVAGARTSEGWQAAERPRRRELVVALTGRELEVLQLVVCGYSTQQMAGQLGVSRHTVRTHVQQVLRKLGVHARGKVARAAANAGLVDVAALSESSHR
jgi:DNA-binding NarL/FixJ family response regulator